MYSILARERERDRVIQRVKPLKITVIPVYYHVSSKETLENNSNNSICVVFKPGASLSESWRDWEREREREREREYYIVLHNTI